MLSHAHTAWCQSGAYWPASSRHNCVDPQPAQLLNAVSKPERVIHVHCAAHSAWLHHSEWVSTIYWHFGVTVCVSNVFSTSLKATAMPSAAIICDPIAISPMRVQAAVVRRLSAGSPYFNLPGLTPAALISSTPQLWQCVTSQRKDSSRPTPDLQHPLDQLTFPSYPSSVWNFPFPPTGFNQCSGSAVTFHVHATLFIRFWHSIEYTEGLFLRNNSLRRVGR